MTEELRGPKAEGTKVRTEEGRSVFSPSNLPTFLPSSSGPSSSSRTPTLGVAAHFEPGVRACVEAGTKALVALGLHHIRVEVPWADWCDAGTKEWHQWLMGALSQQFTVLPALSYLPPSSERAGAPLIPPENPTAFADFLDELVAHLAGEFEWIELPCAPARPDLWDWRLDPRGRIFSQIVASAANRGRQRSLKTVLGGLQAGDLGWLSLLCENGVVDFADAIGLQDDPAAPADGQYWAQAVREGRHILKEHCREVPLWLNGAGCSTDNYDEFAQCETLVSLLNTDVERVYWSGLQDSDRPLLHQTGSRESRRCPGLLRRDGSPKLLFRLWHSQGVEGVRQFVEWTHASRRPRTEDRRQRTEDRGQNPEGKKVGTEEGRSVFSSSNPPASFPSASDSPTTDYRLPTAGLRPVLITGGAGFIGSNLAERLLQAGRPVMILDNLSRAGVEHNIRYLCDTYSDLLEVYVGDVRNKALVETLVARAESIFHLAAQVAVTTSLTDPEGDFESNLQGTLNVLEAARKQEPLPVLLFTSTSKVYGNLADIELIPVGKRHVPRDHGTRTCGIDESRPLSFHSPYGCSKGAADQYVLDYARMYGLPGVVFRMSCIYGRRQLGTEDQGWVAHFALQMLRDGTLTIYGDGRQVRDILYIDDLLDALLLAMKHIAKVAGQPFNIGGGPDNAVSLLEVIRQLAELSGVEPQIRYGPRRRGDQPYYVSDTRRFTKATGWTPQVSAVRGVPRLYHWILENVQPGVLEIPDRAESGSEVVP
jgi:CDP-paratose 2-epimerase